jgi:hypothetical protein
MSYFLDHRQPRFNAITVRCLMWCLWLTGVCGTSCWREPSIISSACSRNSWLSWGLRCSPEYSIWVERKQTTRSLCGDDISLRKRLFPCGTIQRGEMFLTDCICTSSKQSISLIAVSCLQRCKDSNVTGLELMRSVGGEATQDNVVFETKL